MLMDFGFNACLLLLLLAILIPVRPPPRAAAVDYLLMPKYTHKASERGPDETWNARADDHDEMLISHTRVGTQHLIWPQQASSSQGIGERILKFLNPFQSPIEFQSRSFHFVFLLRATTIRHHAGSEEVQWVSYEKSSVIN